MKSYSPIIPEGTHLADSKTHREQFAVLYYPMITIKLSDKLNGLKSKFQNSIFKSNSVLLEERSKTFSVFIGRELTADNQYVHIEIGEIKNIFTMDTLPEA
jgi:hypothetical protein